MKYVIILFTVCIISGCGSFATNRYSISTDNAVMLRSFEGSQLNVENFFDKNNVSEISCHFHGSVHTVDGEPFAKFIEKALSDELKMAGVYSKTAPVTISGHLDSIDFSTAFDTRWDITLTLKSSTGKSVTITENYQYNGSVFGSDGGECGQAALAFVPAVQNLVGKIIAQLPNLAN